MKIQLCILAVLAFVSFGAIPVLAGQDAYYTCPMHSEIHGHKEGECPICSMELVTADSTNHMMIHDGSKNKMSAEKTDNSIALHVPDIIKLEKGKLVTLKVQLTKIQNNQPISINQLNEVHTQRFHALIIDQSMTDYHHVHPVQTNKKGEYSLTFTPKKSDDYRIWADVTPAATGKQEYARADLKANQRKSEAVSKKLNNTAVVDGLTFKISFDAPLQSGQVTMGKLRVEKDGKPFNRLEPIMGAYAHIVGFNEDLKTVAHIHPMGEEPTVKSQRGGPDLEFHIEPAKPGFTKMFAQIRVNGKDIFAPFGLLVTGKK